jgi:dynein heavy chain
VNACMSARLNTASPLPPERLQEYLLRYRRHTHVTPRSYLSFISTFKELYARKLAHGRALVASIRTGLEKMNEAKVAVNLMQVRWCGAGVWWRRR